MKLTKNEITGILNNWNLGDLIELKKAEKGVVNHNWIVKTTNGKYVLRVLPEGRTLPNLKFELKYINYLDKHGFDYGLPRPIKTKNDNEIIKFRNHFIWLYSFLAGEVKEVFGKEELKETARMMAKYHLILEKGEICNIVGISKPYVKDLIIKESKQYTNLILKSKNKTEGDIIYLENLKKLLPILDSVDSKNYGKLKQYPIHRDLNPENIIWQGSRISGVIDFENVSTLNEPLIKDVATLLQLGCSSDGEELDITKAKYFIEEYNKVRKLREEEIKLLPDIIAAAYIEDFNYAYWMLKNDSKRAKLYRLNKYARAAQWYWNNGDLIAEKLK